MPNALKNAKFEQFGMKNANMVTLTANCAFPTVCKSNTDPQQVM